MGQEEGGRPLCEYTTVARKKRLPLTIPPVAYYNKTAKHITATRIPNARINIFLIFSINNVVDTNVSSDNSLPVTHFHGRFITFLGIHFIKKVMGKHDFRN